MRTKALALLAVVTFALGAAACSSDDDSNSSSQPTGTTECPFSGTTKTQTLNAGSSLSTAIVTKVDPTASGCIDSVRFDFSPATPGVTIGYQPGPFTNADGQPIAIKGTPLVVTFNPATLTGAAGQPSYSQPTQITPKGLNHVNSVTVAQAPSGQVEFILDLDSKLQYATSISATPAYFVLSIG